jgi:hypothetical protein
MGRVDRSSRAMLNPPQLYHAERCRAAQITWQLWRCDLIKPYENSRNRNRKSDLKELEKTAQRAIFGKNRT